jgi:hypothetical protein
MIALFRPTSCITGFVKNCNRKVRRKHKLADFIAKRVAILSWRVRNNAWRGYTRLLFYVTRLTLFLTRQRFLIAVSGKQSTGSSLNRKA